MPFRNMMALGRRWYCGLPQRSGPTGRSADGDPLSLTFLSILPGGELDYRRRLALTPIICLLDAPETKHTEPVVALEDQ